ncbi:emopamil-binding protein-like [Saccoglossus kowalevskii]|uniref:Emopamil-binding protein-like n=1 Tax=Saccoglossus kowalevskii TaxID=10224 RepID=A0ABM0GMZ1_SACKO|nr:PREDICTED: emopamil-binding protein-like [Saccoglossus kowalevskii]
MAVETEGESVVNNAASIICCVFLGVPIVASCVLSQVVGKKLPRLDKLFITFVAFDVLFHSTFEASYLYLVYTGTLKSDNTIAVIHQEYGEADKRWTDVDPLLLGCVMLFVGLLAPLECLLIYAIANTKYFRHFLQIVVAVTILFADWILVVPEMLMGAPNINLSSTTWLVIFTVFGVVYTACPVSMLCNSYKSCKTTKSITNSSSAADTAPRRSARKKKQ